MKRLLTFAAALALIAQPMSAQETVPVYKNTSYSFMLLSSFDVK